MNINKASFSTLFAMGTFAVGTTLFIAFEITKYESILMIGLAYLLIAILLNSMILFNLFYELYTNSNKEEILIKILILLSNIPFTYLYLTLISNNQ